MVNRASGQFRRRDGRLHTRAKDRTPALPSSPVTRLRAQLDSCQIAVKQSVRLVALGGLGEIGMNCMSIESGDHRILVDCGITFPDQPFGTDVIRPDFSYLNEE